MAALTVVFREGRGVGKSTTPGGHCEKEGLKKSDRHDVPLGHGSGEPFIERV